MLDRLLRQVHIHHVLILLQLRDWPWICCQEQEIDPEVPERKHLVVVVQQGLVLLLPLHIAECLVVELGDRTCRLSALIGKPTSAVGAEHLARLLLIQVPLVLLTQLSDSQVRKGK